MSGLKIITRPSDEKSLCVPFAQVWGGLMGRFEQQIPTLNSNVLLRARTVDGDVVQLDQSGALEFLWVEKRPPHVEDEKPSK